MGKGGWYDPGVYISPLDPTCEVRFRYTFNGQIEGTDPNAQTTVEKLKLDLPKLNALREAAIEPFLDEALSPDELAEYVRGYLKEKINNDKKLFQVYINYSSLARFMEHQGLLRAWWALRFGRNPTLRPTIGLCGLMPANPQNKP